MHRYLRCHNLEKELNDLKTEKDTFKNKISQPEGISVDDEQKRKDTKRKDEITRETIPTSLERTDKIQLGHTEMWIRTKEKIKTKKRDLLREKKKNGGKEWRAIRREGGTKIEVTSSNRSKEAGPAKDSK